MSLRASDHTGVAISLKMGIPTVALLPRNDNFVFTTFYTTFDGEDMPHYAEICHEAGRAYYLKSFMFYSKLGIS